MPTLTHILCLFITAKVTGCHDTCYGNLEWILLCINGIWAAEIITLTSEVKNFAIAVCSIMEVLESVQFMFSNIYR